MRNTGFRSYLIIYIIATLCISANASVINIGSQREFNSLNSKINDAVDRGEKSVEINLQKQTYFYKQDHISLANKTWGGVSISIKGNGSTLIAQGNELADGDSYTRSFSHGYGYVSEQKGEVPLWGDLLQSQGEVEIVNKKDKLCRLRFDDAIKASAEDCKNAYICVTQWFKSNIYKVERIEKGWIYFTVSDLAYNNSYKCWSINTDLGYGKINPRFRICNIAMNEEPLVRVSNNKVSLPSGFDNLHECTITRFVNISTCTFNNFSIEDIHFLGNRESDNYLLQFTRANANAIAIKNCTFEGIRSGIIQSIKSNNLTIENNTFKDCYRYGVFSSGCANTLINNNFFGNMNKARLNQFCIRCADNGFKISSNTFEDFGYGGISIGGWWAADKGNTIAGICELNELYYTEDYFANAMKYMLMDSGAIYLYTQQDNTEVRYNYIHDYTGAHDNRGIFCDDGAFNFKIYGNIIVNTPNSYSIDARRTLSIEKNAKSKVQRVNFNNSIYENIIDGSIRFEARDRNANCQLGKNIFLSANSRTQTNSIADLRSNSSFTTLPYYGVVNNKIRTSQNNLRKLSKLSSYRNIKQWIEQ